MKNKIVTNIFLFSAVLALTGCDTESENKSITLKGPNDNEIIEIVNSKEKAYIDAMYNQAGNIPDNLKYCVNDLAGDTVKIADYYLPYTAGKGIKVNLGFNHHGFGAGKTYCYHIATKEDFSDDLKIFSKDSSLSIHSLKGNTTYYWRVSDADELIFSPTKTFKTTVGWRDMDAGLTNNVRDLGGHLVKGNKIIKQGLLYRGCELNIEDYEDGSGAKHTKTINDDTVYTFKSIMHVGTEIDLRSATEANSMVVSNLGWSVTYDRESIGGYGSLIRSTSDAKKVKTIFNYFLKASEDSAVYYHCWGGADRTGTISFLLGGLLGMSYTDLIIDYELTSFSYNLREHDKIGTYSDFPSLISALKEVTNHNETNPDIQEMVITYLTNNVGLTNSDIETLQNKMLEDYHE